MPQITDVKWALETLNDRQTLYDLYRNYYEGDHTLLVCREKITNAFGSLFKAFADNLCPVVVDTVADRLTITGFEAETELDTPGTSEVAKQAWEIWKDNRMDRLAGQIHNEALVEGDAYVIVWPDEEEPNRPRIFFNPAKQMMARYSVDDPSEIEFAAKVWVDYEGIFHLNIYYPDRIEKFQCTKEVDISPTTGVLLPTDEGLFAKTAEVAHPYERVPVFHFANNAQVGEPGFSELRDIVRLNDALNKTVMDMLVGMERVARPQRWVTGLEIILGEDGLPIQPFSPGEDKVWAAGDAEARFGEFRDTDLTQFINVEENFRTEIARVSRVPLHYFQMKADFPSGVALQAAEAPLIAKIKDRQVAFGNTWEDLISLALTIKTGQEQAKLKCLWTDPTPRIDKEVVEIVTAKKALGISQEQALRELSYSDEQIEAFAKENQAHVEQENENQVILQKEIARATPKLVPGGSKQPKGR